MVDETDNQEIQGNEPQDEAAAPQPARRKGFFIGKERLSAHWIVVSLVSLLVIGVVLFGVIDVREGMSLHPTVLRKEGEVDILQKEVGQWMELKSGMKIKPGDVIRTRKGAEVDLNVPDMYRLRVKENSEIVITNSALFKRRNELICRLKRGKVLVDTDEKFEGKRLKVKTPVAVACARGTSFVVSYDPEEKRMWVGVLEGEVKVEPTKPGGKSVVLKPLEHSEIRAEQSPSNPEKVKYQQWADMKEIYEMKEKKSKADLPHYEAMVGNILEKCVDHGTFYKPDYGFCNRDFANDPTRGWVLRIDYDVFPPGSFSGVYIRVHPFDLFTCESLSFWVRGDAREGVPDLFEVEFKQKAKIWAVYKIDSITTDWKEYTFPIHVIPGALVNEVTIVFKNYPVGRNKHGAIYIDDFSLKEKSKAQLESDRIAAQAEEAKKKQRPVAPKKEAVALKKAPAAQAASVLKEETAPESKPAVESETLAPTQAQETAVAEPATLVREEPSKKSAQEKPSAPPQPQS
ncbi:MAG: FecR domain-containing protein [Candidatus Omnitrophica bacterium]|nr:FecR domain-containing protein [Candidatus Omnitrophota bacterium]